MRVGDNLETFGATYDMASGADAITLRASTPLRVVRFGFNVSVDLTGSGSLELDITTHAADGTPTRSAPVGGVSCDAGALLIGAVAYAEPDEEVILKPGDILHIDQTGNWGAGDAFVWVQYQKLNWDIDSPNADYDDAVPTNRMTNGTTDI